MATFEQRNELKEFLQKNDIETKIHYPIPLHKQKAARSHCKFNEKDLKNVEYQAKHLLTILVHQFLCEEHMNYISDKIYQFYDIKP